MCKKQFIIVWGDGYKPDHKTIEAGYMTEDNGFDKGDIDGITKVLRVGEAWRCNDIWTVTVVRIEDKQ